MKDIDFTEIWHKNAVIGDGPLLALKVADEI